MDKTWMAVLVIAVVAIGAWAVFGSNKGVDKSKIVKIGISQIAPHVVLDREPIVEENKPSPITSESLPIVLYCANSRYPHSNSVTEEFPEIAAAGFNVLQSYQFEVANYNLDPWNSDEAAREYLDAAERNGLKVLLGLAIGLHDDTIKKDLRFIKKRVPLFKDHPALFGWQLADEPASIPIPLANLERAYQKINTIDPVHPVTIAEVADIDEGYPYLAALPFDIWMPDSFVTIPLESYHGRRKVLRNAVEILASRGKSVIPHLNVGNLAKDRVSCPPDIADQYPECTINRYPTAEEMRFVAYDMLAQGARGLSFLCYRYNYDEDDPGDDISFKNNPSQWQAIASVASELKTMSPILTAPDSKLSIGISPPDTEIEFISKAYQDAVYLIATNPSPEEKEITFTFTLKQPISLVNVLHESRTIVPRQSRDGRKQTYSFTDKFRDYAVHVYEIR